MTAVFDFGCSHQSSTDTTQHNTTDRFGSIKDTCLTKAWFHGKHYARVDRAHKGWLKSISKIQPNCHLYIKLHLDCFKLLCIDSVICLLVADYYFCREYQSSCQVVGILNLTFFLDRTEFRHAAAVHHSFFSNMWKKIIIEIKVKHILG